MYHWRHNGRRKYHLATTLPCVCCLASAVCGIFDKGDSVGFPQGFVWGAAAAAYQIEGAAYEDGRGLSVWDVFAHEPGRIFNNDTGDVACDHYHRYKEDVALMREVGLQAYRFSISWPRVLPAGTGKVNAAGLDFYDRLVDELLAAGIVPYATLFHWDFPYDLYCRGGWLNRESADWFAEYASLMAGRLGDRVKHWMTFNEHSVFVLLGHQTGAHAPGDCWSQPKILRIAHHVLLAHGKGVQAVRAAAPGPVKVAAVPTGTVTIPASDSARDIEAARQAMFSIAGTGLWSHSWWMDPCILGHYPADGLALYEKDMPEIRAGDMETICQPLDFYAMNIYQGGTVRAGAGGEPELLPNPVGEPTTSFPWPVTPDALYWGPRFVYERYKLSVFITENGLANPDWVSLDGKVHDPQRIDFTARYLASFCRAADNGVEIGGYFHWSILDNFEWGFGMRHRFGLVYVDYLTQQRILKDSAYWYREVIASNGAQLTGPADVASG